MATATSVAAQRWPHLLNEVIDTAVNPHLARPETRSTARDLIRALLAPLTRKNCWTLAEHAGHGAPYRMQHLLARAHLNENALAAALRSYVIRCLGTDDVVLVVDETGDIKKGRDTVGVSRQYTGVTGQIENCQVAVYLAYTTPDAHALIDHRLYLPSSWSEDAARLATAGVPTDVGFVTKPELARQMIAAALEHVPHAWVAGDEVYGRNPDLRAYLEKHRVGYVMEMAATDTITTPREPLTVKELAVLVPTQAWQKRSAGAGAKGQRFYDWALIDDVADSDGVRWVLIRRNRTTAELAFFHCYAPEVVSLGRLVAVAGRRWRVEESFAQGKGLAGLDEHQVRTWTSWHRWSLLVMVAYGFLAACRLREARHHPAPEGLVALTCNEIARLLEALFPPELHPEHVLAWSVFRRSHQARALHCHYRRQAAQES
ncbi:IS701 family transposase [Nocardiopsis sp. FIRDI 009]|uniref:IS701 family transposase n=1 Tax=Nocardiopsis sp. FIRDI 009 TaxID=714197 RepID=UPI001E3E4C93|nr:IS701 family transposase [Nocardiopsis sp. FIRDI 009]